MVQQPSYWKVLTRRKVLAYESGEVETKLNRILNLYDLTALGVGSTLGAGVYVLAGQIAKEQAGPSVMLSFAIAAIASLLAGVCYAEFGARVPKAGSAYVYSYVCIGEFAAFVIGWNLMLEYIIGTAAVCRGISVYLDTLINNTLQNTFAEIAPMHVSFLGSYFDFFAFGLVVIFGIALAFGVETSKIANNFCTCLNISILLFVIIAGSIKANFANWTIDVSKVDVKDTDIGTGGYFPFGFAGTLKGAATCFFGFVGFDCIATTGEEVRNPRKNIPRSILLSLLIIFICYFGVSTVLTLMVPYYLQDTNAPLPYAFKEVGWNFAMWIVSIGGLIGLLASLFGALFPLPRVMYSMAEDGLLFRFLGKVSPRFRVPVMGSIFAAVFTALIAGLFDLTQLVNLLSIGTLLAYSVVAISVTILRYMDNSEESERVNGHQTLSENSMLTSSGTRVTFSSIMQQLFNLKRIKTPNALSTRIVGTLITVFCLLSLGIGLILMQAYDALVQNEVWALVVLVLLIVLTALVLLAMCLQPREAYIYTFRVPFVPIVPALSIFINIYLMLQLDVMTWIRFGVWMALGIPMFIACWCMYDIKNPAKRNPKRIAFEKALKESAHYKPSPNEDLGFAYLESNNNNIEQNCIKTNKTPNGTATTTLLNNQNSVKSLDEIMNLNEVGEDLIEMKHPNGKIFFIEDTKSNTSTATLEKSDELKHNSSLEATDEEQSALAMLDDVLQAEDDITLAASHHVVDYGRKISVDSEMLPSVIESTTVATVHSSSDSSEKGLDDLSEGDSDENSSNASLNGDIRQKEIEMVAQSFIEELLNSKELQDALEEQEQKLHETKNESLVRSTTMPVMLKELLEKQKLIGASKKETVAPDQTIDAPKAVINRSVSEASLLSATSVEDPMHSDNFKNKLSKILMRAPSTAAATTNHRAATNETKNFSEGDTTIQTKAETPRPVLKQSKSEADIKKLVLKAIEGTGLNLDESSDDLNKTTATPLKDENGIPKAPKFDPMLYKTINTLSKNKERPSLDKLLKKDEEQRPLERTPKELPEETQVPFKMKLEAILKRGPSHRSQKRPDVEIRRPKSVGPTLVALQQEFEHEASKELASPATKRLTTKSESNLTAISNSEPSDDAAAMIINMRKALKPTKNGVDKL